MKIKTKTLSLLYNIREDRMKLVINKDEKDPIVFWITRHFYFSLLFELETFLEQRHITLPHPLHEKSGNIKKSTQNKAQKDSQKTKPKEVTAVAKKESDISSSLLENININFIKEKGVFVFVLQSSTIEAKSIFTMDQFLDFYTILRSRYPKGEWGII